MRYLAAIVLISFVFINASSQKGLISFVRDSYPSVSKDGQWITFHSNRSGKQAVYIVDSAGKNLKQLTNYGWDEGTPKWSPDGNQIVFAAEPEPDNSEIYIINRDGTGLKRLTNTKGDDSHPSWSADGKKIIFNSARTSPDLSLPWNRQYLEIFEMNSDGTGIRQLTNNKTICTYPAYSPDGKKIVYRKVTSDPGLNWNFSHSPRNSEVFVSDINGTNEINISKNAAFDGWPTWSPDGQWILFGSNRAGPANVGSLFIAKPDGTGVQRITHGPMGYAQPAWSSDGKWIYAYMNSEDEEREYGFIQRIPSTLYGGMQGERLITTVSDWYPSASPDGKLIAFHSNRNGNQAIYTIDTAGNNLKQLTNLSWAGGPKWSPDGSKIVFGGISELGNIDVFVMNNDGSGLKRLTFTPGDDTHPNWSSDGKKIIFNSARTTPDLKMPWNKQIHEIFEMNADGSRPRQITGFKTISTYPCYSPDGNSIVFRRVVDEPSFQWDLSSGARNSEVFVCDMNGANEINISKNPAFDGWPVWSPDGKYIAFASNRSGPANVGSVFIVKPDGTGTKQISSGIIGHTAPSWSPDGKWIYAFMNVETIDYGYGFIQKFPFEPSSK